MKRPLYCSTGALVGRVNGYDFRGAMKILRSLYEEERIRGLELMMLPAYYENRAAVTEAVRQSGVPSPVIHCEKEIGTMLSDAGALTDSGHEEEARALSEEAFRLFRLNCAFAEDLGIPRMVIHLWGGRTSDSHIARNVGALPDLTETAAAHGLRLLVEIVPSSAGDPLSNWKRVLPFLGNGGLIFDSRFGKLHEQIRETLTDPAVTPRIEHVHVSDFGGGYREFSALRPILHPGEGKIDFPALAGLLDRMGYAGSVTLESPVMGENGWNVPKLGRTLSYLGSLL